MLKFTFQIPQHFMTKSAKFQNHIKNDPLSGACAPTEGAIFFSEILILVSSISYLSMVEKTKRFLMGENSIFTNNKVKSFRNLEILWYKRDFFNFLQAITFDTFMITNWNFLHIFYTGNTTGTYRTKQSKVNSKALIFIRKLENNEISLILERFLIISQCINFW